MAQAEGVNAMTACEKVFNTVELLDIILVYDVQPGYYLYFGSDADQFRITFLLQRVNKVFYDHINGDTEIARAVHLVPGGISTIRVHLMQHYPQLSKVLSPNLGSDWICNPYIRLQFMRKQPNRQLSSEPWSNFRFFQPPITKPGMVTTGGIVDTQYGGTAPAYEQGIVVRETGLTVKDVVEAGKSYLDNAPKWAYYNGVLFFARQDENGKELVDLDPRAYDEAVCVGRVKETSR